MVEGDILLLTNGKLLRVDETENEHGMLVVTYIDQDHHSFIDSDSLDVAHNLGQGPIVLSHFHGLRGIHVRLNRLSCV